jgi:hypothetical protein
MGIQQVTVNNQAALDSAVTSYIAKGFVVANRGENFATLQKQKQFSVLWAVIGFFLCLLPLLIYLIVYASQPDVQVVEVRIQ